MIIRSLNLNKNNNSFDVHSYEPKINHIVDKHIKLIKRDLKYCLSGGITEKS